MSRKRSDNVAFTNEFLESGNEENSDLKFSYGVMWPKSEKDESPGIKYSETRVSLVTRQTCKLTPHFNFKLTIYRKELRTWPTLSTMNSQTSMRMITNCERS